MHFEKAKGVYFDYILTLMVFFLLAQTHILCIDN